MVGRDEIDQVGLEKIPGKCLGLGVRRAVITGKASGVHVLLANLTGEMKYRNAVMYYCNYIVNDVPRTPKGLAFINEWGSLRNAANAAFICMKVHFKFERIFKGKHLKS